ncbi:MAG TPA: alpha amylase C-terminal domain-containing protein [Bryobacteraceae bacterium]|nr:alpha amylase C-terminal domain-containing protein [Bryobacteraceae bacterium]
MANRARFYEKMGAHLTPNGAHFAVAAPAAASVSVIGDFNGWDLQNLPLENAAGGIWQGTVVGVKVGDRYKYHVRSRFNESRVDRSDPYAFCTEALPGDASRVWDLDSFQWSDGDWMRSRSTTPAERPLLIYEVHAGSWMRVPEAGNRWTTWREVAEKLPEYAHDNGYTHVEFLPITEYSGDDPSGYLTTAHFAPTSRFGTPDQFMHLINALHQRGIGIILDWTAARFLSDTRDFLIDNALFWLDKYHIDGLRVIESEPHPESGSLLRLLLERVHAEHPSAIMIAEQFGFKWNIDWMRNAVAYMSIDPVRRNVHHGQILPDLARAFQEEFILPLPHDEVAHGMGALIRRMPGDDWRKFANLRLLYGYMFAHPGKKLIFMGSDFGQWNEWNPNASLDWHLQSDPRHSGLLRWVRDLNTTLRGEPALYERDCEPAGFEWIDFSDSDRCIISFLRKGRAPGDLILFVCNFTPSTHHNYRVGAPSGGYWREVLNGDARLYGGSGQGNMGGVDASPLPMHGRAWSLSITVPPLAVAAFKSAERR